MVDTGNDAAGIKRLVRKYRQAFRISENLDHYSPADYQAAEKRYVKLCLEVGPAALAERTSTSLSTPTSS